MSRRKGDTPRPPSGPIAPWRLALVIVAVASTSGAVLVQSVQTGVGLDLALGRALGVAVVLWILLGSIDRVLARAQLARHADEGDPLVDGSTKPGDTLAGHHPHH